ncbi:MAG: hypothetical protein ACTSVI_15370 [Promethearchaeota archaeon]
MTLSYLIVSIYLIVRQVLWILTYGLDANFTYQDPDMASIPWWIHVVMHGTPII